MENLEISNDTLARLYNLFVEFQHLLNDIQPGLTLPLPEGDPSEIDAMKIQWLAVQIKRGLT